MVTIAEQFSIVLEDFITYVNNNIDNDTIKSHISSWAGRPLEDTVLLIDRYLSEWAGNMHVYVAVLYSTFGVQPSLEVSVKLVEYLELLQQLAHTIVKN